MPQVVTGRASCILGPSAVAMAGMRGLLGLAAVAIVTLWLRRDATFVGPVNNARPSKVSRREVSSNT